jgi:predicted MarR family transcription regulator
MQASMEETMSTTARSAGQPAAPRSSARVGRDDVDEAIWADFEYALWQLSGAFARWRRDCLASVSGVSLSGTEASILHVVHMNGTPKGLMEISRLLHRDDLPNLQYGLKKLQRLGLVEKRGASRKTMNYDATAEGNRIVEAFLRKRHETLMALLAHVADLPEGLREMITRMHLLTGIYDQSSELVRAHQP